MIARLLPILISTYFFFISCSLFAPAYEFKTDLFQITIDETGSITHFIDLQKDIDYLANQISSPLMSVRIDNELLSPQSAQMMDNNQVLLLKYTNGVEAKLKVKTNHTHITFELTEISEQDRVELIIWGPYQTTINKTIGETVGIVRGDEYAIGIQALNPKTLGGYPWNENDCMPQLDIFDQDDLSDMSEEGKRYVLYRVEAAKPTDTGSSLQAYCRNRNKERIIENWGHEKYTAPPFEDGGIIGSKIALFGCPVEQTLATIGKIELAENLPHPLIDGQWSKITKAASSAYLIMGFGEQDIEKSLDVCQKAGFKYVYHPGPFENWGHFKLNEIQFPNGVASMRNCVEKAKARNIILGAHTLTNFITTNDPYVTPVPDKRLAKVGISTISSDIDKKQTEIPIESPDFFNQFKNNHLKSAVIGNELIRYGSVSEEAPWRLLDCQRGAFKTEISVHKKGETIAKLADHAYKVFLTDAELSIEVSKNIAELLNKTGLGMISFDGLEGNRSTGMGNYGEVLFTNTWFENINDDIKSHYIVSASRTSHYFWHIYTRMNWGEPWYAGFRESQTEYRMKNQPYFKRNLMPAMLGWFKMTPETSLEDIEWMLARSAAFNAGYAFVTGYETIENNHQSDEIFNLLGQWEKARMSGAFNEEQRSKMEDINNEFHLETVSESEWQLQQIFSHKFKHEKKVRQPGEPLYSTFDFENAAKDQTMNFILSAIDGGIKQIKIEIDNYKQILLPITLKEGETIKYTGGKSATVYSKNWRKLKEIDIDASAFSLSKGDHKITFDCQFTKGKEPYAKFEVRIAGPAEIMKRN